MPWVGHAIERRAGTRAGSGSFDSTRRRGSFRAQQRARAATATQVGETKADDGTRRLQFSVALATITSHTEPPTRRWEISRWLAVFLAGAWRLGRHSGRQVFSAGRTPIRGLLERTPPLFSSTWRCRFASPVGCVRGFVAGAWNPRPSSGDGKCPQAPGLRCDLQRSRERRDGGVARSRKNPRSSLAVAFTSRADPR